MNTKFKIGDKIHFMSNNEPKSEKIKGISIHQGEIKELHFKNKKEDGTQILYHYENYGSVYENNVFKSLEDLKNKLFPVNSTKS